MNWENQWGNRGGALRKPGPMGIREERSRAGTYMGNGLNTNYGNQWNLRD